MTFFPFSFHFSAGSILKGISLKHGKKPFVLDENRRNTYKQSSSIAVGREPSVLTTFDGEKKQLMPVCISLMFCMYYLVDSFEEDNQAVTGLHGGWNSSTIR